MSVTKRNYVPGSYEVVDKEPCGTIQAGVFQHFVLDDYFKFIMADISVFHGITQLPLDPVAYTLAVDQKYTEIESEFTGKQLYAMIKITASQYNGEPFFVSGKNYGTFVDNEQMKKYVDDNSGSTNLTVIDRDSDSLVIKPSSGLGAEIPAATTSLAGLMTADDKTELITANLPEPWTDGNGVISGMSLEVGTPNTTFSVLGGSYHKIGLQTPVNFEHVLNIPVTNLATSNHTHVAVRVSDSVVIQKTTEFTEQERRTHVILGVVVHSDLATVNVTNSLPDVAVNSLSQLNDLLDVLRVINDGGNVISPNGANLKINKSAGTIFKKGVGFSTDANRPHSLDLGSLTAPATLRFRTSTGVETANTDTFPLKWENPLGTIDDIPSSHFAIFRVYLFPSNLIRVQYGQEAYQTMAEAMNGLYGEAFVTEENIAENGLLRAYIIVGANTTSFLDESKVRIIEADRFGSMPLSGGSNFAVNDTSGLYVCRSNEELLSALADTAFMVKEITLVDESASLYLVATDASVYGKTITIDGHGLHLNGVMVNANENQQLEVRVKCPLIKSGGSATSLTITGLDLTVRYMSGSNRTVITADGPNYAGSLTYELLGQAIDVIGGTQAVGQGFWDNTNTSVAPENTKRYHGVYHDGTNYESDLIYDEVTGELYFSAPTTIYDQTGVKYTIPTTTMFDTTGLASGIYFVSMNSAGVISGSTTPWNQLIESPIAIIVHKNGGLSKGWDERHRHYRNAAATNAAHYSDGTILRTKPTIAGFTLNGTTDAANSYSLSSVVVQDEDISMDTRTKTEIQTISQIQVDAVGDIAFVSTNAHGYNVGTTYPTKQVTAVGGGIAEITPVINGTYFNMYLLAGTFLDESYRYFVAAGYQQWNKTSSGNTIALSNAISALAGNDCPVFKKLNLQEVNTFLKLTYFVKSSNNQIGKAQLVNVQEITGNRQQNLSTTVTGTTPNLQLVTDASATTTNIITTGGYIDTTLTSGNVVIGGGATKLTSLSRSGIDSRTSFPAAAHSHTLASVLATGADANNVAITGFKRATANTGSSYLDLGSAVTACSPTLINLDSAQVEVGRAIFKVLSQELGVDMDVDGIDASPSGRQLITRDWGNAKINALLPAIDEGGFWVADATGKPVEAVGSSFGQTLKYDRAGGIVSIERNISDTYRTTFDAGTTQHFFTNSTGDTSKFLGIYDNIIAFHTIKTGAGAYDNTNQILMLPTGALHLEGDMQLQKISVGSGSAIGSGVIDIDCTEFSTLSFANLADGHLAIGNISSSAMAPSIYGKSSNNAGINFRSFSADAAPLDMVVDMREVVGGADFSTIDNSKGFVVRRNSTNLFQVYRNGTINATGGVRSNIAGQAHVAIMQPSSTFGQYVFGGSPTGDVTPTVFVKIGSSTLEYNNGTNSYQIRHAGNFVAGTDYLPMSGGNLTGALKTSSVNGIGYATGAGGTVTQTTSRGSSVTINKACGSITLVSAAGSTTWNFFAVINSVVAATDTIIVNQKSGTDQYEIHVTNVAAATFRIAFRTTSGTATDQPVFNFSIIKAVTA